MGHPVDALLYAFAVFYFLVQGLNCFTELVGALGYLAFQLSLRLGEHRLNMLAFSDIHQNPDFSLRAVQGVYPAAACFAVNVVALAVPQRDLSLKVACTSHADLCQHTQGG